MNPEAPKYLDLPDEMEALECEGLAKGQAEIILAKVREIGQRIEERVRRVLDRNGLNGHPTNF